MEPRIQYAQTKDGVSIAFSTTGGGQPLVHMPHRVFSHFQREWQYAEQRRWYESLARRYTLIRYDHRGSGLSQRDIEGLSLEKLALDLDAVVDSLGLSSFSVFAPFRSGPTAIMYAAEHPERVARLVLMNTYARASDFPRSPRQGAILGLIDTDWDLFTETFAHEVLGWSAGDEARRIAAWMRESITPEVYREFEAIRTADVSHLLAKVQTPTLVIQGSHVPLEAGVGGRLASQIPGARLVITEGEYKAPFRGDTEPLLRAISEFLAEDRERPASTGSAPVGVVTVLFTDMKGSTAITQRLGDAKAQELLRTHNIIVRDALELHGGTEIKHTGDGIMAAFPFASRALDCAVAIQSAVAARVERQPELPLSVRIGLNAGEPVAEEEDLFGASVQLARRICDHAEPGQIVASNVVRELAAGKGFLFADRGDAALRGFEDPVRLYEVRWREES